MKTDTSTPRVAVLAPTTARLAWLSGLCQSTVPSIRIEPVRDMADLMTRVAAGAAELVLLDGQSATDLPEEAATVLKGLHASLQVVIVDAAPGLRVPHRVDQLLDSERLGAWLARRFPEAAA